MKLKIFQIDAFASEVFKGNPAAVCVLDSWLPAKLMQNIALENNLSETAFAVKEGNGYLIRWFTPKDEVALCGHATLATAFVLFTEYGYEYSEIEFSTLHSGFLKVRKEDDLYILDFPLDTYSESEIDLSLQDTIGTTVLEQYEGKTDTMLVLKNEADLKALKPDYSRLKTFDKRGFIVTAKGEAVDFVSRFFCPGLGIDEDPVTGSAHTTLSPYWGKKLNKQNMLAKQISERGGNLSIELTSDRVKIGGRAVKYMEGEIWV